MTCPSSLTAPPEAAIPEPAWSRALWSYTTPPAPELTPFAAGQSYDAIVVGAGITGCSTALHLAEAGARVCVLDRTPPGGGTSGRANGQVLAGMHSTPDQIVAAWGEEQGERMVAFSGSAPDIVFGLIERHRIECGAVRAGWLEATRKEGDLKEFAGIVAMWIKRGAPVDLVERPEAERLIGTRTYAGAWRDRRNGTVQPLAYTRGLARAALAAGAAIHVGIDVQRLERQGGTWRLFTNAGSLEARTIVLATNAFTGGLAPRLGRSMIFAHGVQVATPPLPPEIRRTILPEGHACSDVHTLNQRYFRMDESGRLIMGGPAWFTPPRRPQATSFRILEKSLRSIFPQIGDMALETRWYARGAAPLDLVPHLHEPAPGIFSGLGYAGRGIAMGTAFGTLLARRALGEPASALPYPTTALGVLPFNAGSAVRHWLRGAITRLRRS